MSDHGVGLTQRELLMEMREDIKGLKATVDAIARDQALPRRHRRNARTNLDHRVKGESYKVEVFEDAIGLALERVAVSSTLRARTVAEASRPEADGGNVLARARITRERERAALRFAKDRDLGRLEATMAGLDAEAVFERIDVLGANDFTFTLTAHAKAHGRDAAFGVGDQSISIGRSGRGERARADTTSPILLIAVTNVPNSVHRARETA